MSWVNFLMEANSEKSEQNQPRLSLPATYNN